MEIVGLEPRDLPLHLTSIFMAAHPLLAQSGARRLGGKGGPLLEHGMLWLLPEPADSTRP